MANTLKNLFRVQVLSASSFVLYAIVAICVLSNVEAANASENGAGLNLNGGLASPPLASASVPQVSNVAQRAQVKVKRAAASPPDPEAAAARAELNSEKVDPELVNALGNASVNKNARRHPPPPARHGGHTTVIDRQRRDHRAEKAHEARAEVDSIAAAAEAASAEADAIAAAVEASEAIESGDENGGGDYSDGGHLYEENDNGQEAVYEQDSREQAHGGYSGTDGGPALYPTNVDASSNRQFGQAQGSNIDIDISSDDGSAYGGFGSNMIEQIDGASMNIAQELSNTADIKTPISQLLIESKDLAHEIRLVFQVLAKREEYLVNEMEKLKQALSSAIQVLQNNNEVTKLVRTKRGDPQVPYKACVYINPTDDTNTNSLPPAPPQQLTQEAPAPGPYDQYPSQPASQMPTQSQLTGLEGSNDIDLSSVYWLKLPANSEVGVLEKVHRVINDMRGSGRDILIIPVGRGYTTQQDLARGFLRAVHMDDSDEEGKSKLRIRIRRV